MFRRTWKNPSNFPRMLSYFLRSSSVALVEVSTASASSPRQYRSVLICLVAARPDATLNCSNRLRHRGQSSGVLKLKGSGGWRRICAIDSSITAVLTPPYRKYYIPNTLAISAMMSLLVRRRRTSYTPNTQPDFASVYLPVAKCARSFFCRVRL